jgi:hypothetical protein
MAYVPGCRYDLFVSYGSSDNVEGWIEQLVTKLGRDLPGLLGGKFSPRDSIYFDKYKLELGQSFSEELISAARESAVLLAFLSPSYLDSQWCDRESAEFFSKLPHGAADQDCLAPILIRPVKKEQLSRRFRDAQWFSFLLDDGQTRLAPGSARWGKRVETLAEQVRDVLERLRLKCKPIFLGKACSGRAQAIRAELCEEIEHRNVRTSPEYLQTLDDGDLVREHLQEAVLAVHFLGDADLLSLKAMETSAEVCAGSTVLYQPFGAELTDDERIWLEAFERQLPATPGGYQRLHRKNGQDLLFLIDEQIAMPAAATPIKLSERQLALVCEELDVEGVRQLSRAIRGRSEMEIGLPDFFGSSLKATELLHKWHALLRSARALLFYHGKEERQRLERIWAVAGELNGHAIRQWFLGEPGVDSKRIEYPQDLWEIDQILSLIGRKAKEQSA